MKVAKKKYTPLLPVEGAIRIIRAEKVILDHDLAELYGVETRSLNQAVRRNLDRFPEDFMFRLTSSEASNLRSRIVISSSGYGGRRYLPYAFTEHGVVMLSSFLNSERAVQMSLLVVRAFVHMRELIAHNKELAVRVEKLERSHTRTGDVIEVLVEDIDKLAKEIHWIKNPPLKPRRRIGFVVGEEDQ